jgi:F-type H+-transporting ATPase subunit gamma
MADADLGARIDGIRQLGSVVRAMMGIAGARARTARAQIAAVDGFADTLKDAWRRTMTGLPVFAVNPQVRPARIMFCAEQGFVGAFSERLLDAVADDLASADLFLIGSRGAAIAAARGLAPVWSTAMPSRSASLPKFADRILGQVYVGGVARAVEAVYSVWAHGQVLVTRQMLFPHQTRSTASPATAAPLTNLPPRNWRHRLVWT